ncbi:MAG TPA: hypothetical protein VG604_00430 [Candidatus Saccharimonadales bacterium]|nr:hypothetical protein [Candidatus Saccharimonadales bacterium]
MKTGAIVAVVVVILGIGGFALAGHKSTPKKSSDNSSNESGTSNSGTNTSGNTPSSGTTVGRTDFTINANDESADTESINVRKGDTIKITFKVDTSEVYHGGLEFKSDVVSSKPIKPGDSDTVSFVADKSFDFTPFWYQSNIQKDYLIHVNVE